MSDPTHPPTARWRDLFVRKHVASLLVICLAVTLHAADGLLVATMLPVIVADIGGTHLMFGVGMIFYNSKNWIGWGIAGASLVALIFGVIANMTLQLARMSAFDLIVILVLLVGGIGLFLRSLRAG